MESKVSDVTKNTTPEFSWNDREVAWSIWEITVRISFAIRKGHL